MIVFTADRLAPPHLSTVLVSFIPSKALAEFVGKYRHTLKIRYLVCAHERSLDRDRSLELAG